MSILSAQIVSALNNYSSIAPIMTKDLIENVGRTTMAYCNSGEKTRKYEATEKFIDANMSSLFWFGSIPFANKIFNITAFKAAKLNPEISLSFFKEGEKSQSINNVIDKVSKNELASKIVSSKGKIIDIKAVLENVNKNAKMFKNLQISRMLTSLAFATFLSAVVLPKSIIKLTQFFIDKDNKKGKLNTNNNKSISFGGSERFFKTFEQFTGKNKTLKQVAFKSLGTTLFNKALTAQQSALEGMAAMDIAISSGRIYYVNKREKDALNGKKPKVKYAAGLEKFIREAGAFYLIYFGGNHIKKAIDKITKNDLDSLIIEDKNFVKELKSGLLSENPIKSLNDEQILNFIDKNIGSDRNVFIKYAKKMNWIETAKNEKGQTVRNPLKYVDITKLNDNFETIAKNAKEFLTQGSKNLEDFIAQKAKIKRLGIYGNLAASSFAVCYILPKIMYGFRKLYTGSSEEPGIKEVLNNSNKN